MIRTARRLRWAAAVGVVAAPAAFVVLLLLLLTHGANADGQNDPSALAQLADCEVGGSAAGLEADQQRNAHAIATVAMQRGLGRLAVVIGIMTALTESTLHNVDHGDAIGPSSRGLFQQMPSWGPLAVRMDPAGAAGLFFDALARVPGWQSLPPWIAAQAVQHSEFSDGSNYRSNYQQAERITDRLLTTSASAGGCATGTTGPVDPSVAGYQNGQLPASVLCPIASHPQLLLDCQAAVAYNAMDTAFAKAIGKPIGITDAYRSYAQQVDCRAQKGDICAIPGTSNHGWGLAVDIGGLGVDTGSGPAWDWLNRNAGRFDWVHPLWARPGGSNPEPWHWEYRPSVRQGG